jgi:hypothetical protein
MLGAVFGLQVDVVAGIGDPGDCSNRRVACIANFIRRQLGCHYS